MAGFFPIFFKGYWSYGVNANLSTARLGIANAVAGLIIALLAPVLGAMADSAGLRKRLLIFFAYLGVITTAALFLIQQGQWLLAAACYVLATVGFSGGNIFYDALLAHIAPAHRIHVVSGMGFAFGYLGGGLLLLFNVVMTLSPHSFGLPDAQTAVRWSFLTVALWWGLFSVLTILWVPPDPKPLRPAGLAATIKDGLQRVAATLTNLRRQKTILFFLIGYWFYIDGVDTIIRMAVDYGLALGFHSNDLIVALLVVQFVGFPAALVFGRVGQRWGALRAVYAAIVIYMAVTVWGVMIDKKIEFYILAVAIGLVQGGVQALSRSYYAGLVPKEQSAAYFGLYNMLGKFAVIIGPVLMGAVGLAARAIMMPTYATTVQMEAVGRAASRWSMASILLLFVAGIIFLRLSQKASSNADKQ
jgi:UMF1 family MFS transporter